MGKLLAAVACVLLVAMTDATPEISIGPDELHQGDTMVVKWSGALPKKLKVEFSPGAEIEIEVSSSTGTSVPIPGNATSVIVSDPGGQAPAQSDVIFP
jgi:hypothetical protein